MLIRSFFRLRKSKKIFKKIRKLYFKKEKNLDPFAKKKILSQLQKLQSAIHSKNVAEAKDLSKDLLDSSPRLMPRSSLEKGLTFIGSLIFALLVAVVIRQMCFELYSIPTGSMRPTLKEKDFLIVSKSSFGLNVPLMKKHFYFDPSLVQRGNIFIFTSEGLDVTNADMLYFYLFPGKKQFVKRLVGKPGDTLYFYGGKVYGIDKDGNEIREFLDAPWAQSLEHIPFISFQGKSLFNGKDSIVCHQMNQPVGSLKANVFGTIQGKMIGQNGREPLENYSDLWGFKNYAMARLLLPKEAKALHPKIMEDLESAPIYLELNHHPSVREVTLRKNQLPELGYSTSLLPLTKEHIDRISNHLTTARFTVKNGIVIREGYPTSDPHVLKHYPRLPSVPNGTYEIQDGKAYQVYVRGITKELPKDHPLYPKTLEETHLLYNLGIEFLNQYLPVKEKTSLPSRYSYFRDGALYLMGAPIIFKDDPILKSFEMSEKTALRPPFEDAGPPIRANGKMDVELIRKYGLIVPEKMYMALGDNHAMSGDSRDFGFVPEDNVKGTVSLLFSPPGQRWGTLPQPSKPQLHFPNYFVWGSGILITIGYSIYTRRKNRLVWLEPTVG